MTNKLDKTSNPESLIWETDLPLFSRRMLVRWTLAMLATALVMLVFLGTIFIAQGEWDSLASLLALTGVTTGSLWLLGLIIMALMFRGKYQVRYTLSKTGILCETISPLAKQTNRGTILLGALARSPGTLGAGMLAKSQETQQLRWSGAFKAVTHPKEHLILLNNAWRTLLWVQCNSDNYTKVAEAIEHYMKRRRTAKRVPGTSPMPSYLGRSLLVVLACLPLFPLADEFKIDIFLPILTLSFGLAMVWLINLFGWVVLGGLGVQFGMLVLHLMQIRQSMFESDRFYRVYEVLDSNDFTLLLLAAIGSGVLIWLSIGTIRGHWMAALLADQTSMEG